MHQHKSIVVDIDSNLCSAYFLDRLITAQVEVISAGSQQAAKTNQMKIGETLKILSPHSQLFISCHVLSAMPAHLPEFVF